MKAMKLIKEFCNEHELDYAIIENEWLITKPNNEKK